MKENLVLFLNNYDDFLDILIGLEATPEELVEPIKIYKKERKGKSPEEMHVLEADLFLLYLKTLNKI